MQVLSDESPATSVRRARLAAGLSQQTLATQAGISLRTLARIERGEDTLVGTLTAIADALGVPVADLLAPVEPSEAAL